MSIRPIANIVTIINPRPKHRLTGYLLGPNTLNECPMVTQWSERGMVWSVEFLGVFGEFWGFLGGFSEALVKG